MATSKYLISIVGPTAIGKTSFSIELAKKLNTEIISSDSRQFFKEMSIGTAKPHKDEMEGIPHHFVNFLSIHDEYTSGKFENDAMETISQLHQEMDTVIMVGGSGLYVDAVLYGIDEIPSDDVVRFQLIQEYNDKGLEHLQAELKSLDPEHYDFMDIKNPQRLIRALEVCRATGKTYTSFRNRKPKERPFDIIRIGLTADRELIYDRINKRVDLMVEAGLIEEARALHRFKNLNALQTVGYRELFEYFDGKVDLETAIENIKMNTRRFAKRQLTWFRKDKEIKWFDIQNQPEAFEYVASVLK